MPASNLIRGRVPGQTMMSEIIARQRALPRPSALARIIGASPVPKANRPLYLAALGELQVGEALDSVGPEWDVLHVVPVGGATPYIDHLVIGPPGVFTITTRNYAGNEIMVNGDNLQVGGRTVEAVVAARAQAERAAELIAEAAKTAVIVAPVIVAVDPKKLTIRRQPEGLTVVSSKHLLRWLAHLERLLDGKEVAVISDIADRASTWHSTAEPVDDPAELHREFVALRDEVTNAALVRAGWGVAAFLVIAAVVWTTVVLFAQHLSR